MGIILRDGEYSSPATTLLDWKDDRRPTCTHERHSPSILKMVLKMLMLISPAGGILNECKIVSLNRDRPPYHLYKRSSTPTKLTTSMYVRRKRAIVLSDEEDAQVAGSENPKPPNNPARKRPIVLSEDEDDYVPHITADRPHKRRKGCRYIAVMAKRTQRPQEIPKTSRRKLPMLQARLVLETKSQIPSFRKTPLYMSQRFRLSQVILGPRRMKV